MNIKSKLTLAIGILVAMIVLLVVLSVVNLQIQSGSRSRITAGFIVDICCWCRMYMYWYWYVVASSRIN